MTLSTDLVIIEPTDHREVFDFALTLLAEDFDGTPEWDYTPAAESKGFGTSHYATKCGQGLAAWLFVHHADDAPLLVVSPEDEAEWEQTPPACNKHSIRIDWDTGYSYRGKNGEGCGDLHARMVATVGQWLDGKGLTWWWRNEFTGEWHRGFDGLDQLGDAGAEANAWFSNVVRPAIESGVAR